MGGGRQQAKAKNARKQAKKKAKKVARREGVKLREQRQNLAALREHLLTGGIDRVRRFLSSMDDKDEDAFDIDCQDELLGQTALHYAVEAGLEDMVEYLVDHASCCLVTDYLRQTPLHLAAAAGRTSSVTFIAEVFQPPEDNYGYDYDAVGDKDNLGRTPLFLAAVGGHTDTVRALLEVHSPDKRAACHPHLHPLSPQAVAERYKMQLQRNRMGLTPIHAAAQAGHANTVLELLRPLQLRTPGPAARLSLENTFHEMLGVSPTPLHLAAENDHAEVAKALLGLPSHYVDPVARCSPDDSTPPGRRGQTPFHLAAAAGSLATLRILLKHHYRKNRPEQEPEGDGDEEEEDEEGEDERGGRGESAPPSSAVVNDKGGTPLHEASSAAVVELLLRHRARVAGPEDRDGNGRTALHAAAHRGKSGPVQALLDGGCDPNARSAFGCTPLMEAVMPLQMEAEELLDLEELGELNAFLSGCWVIAQALLPDGSVAPQDGYRGRRTAFRSTKPAVLCLLDAPGIDLAAVDLAGKTAWDRTQTLREFWVDFRLSSVITETDIAVSPDTCDLLKPDGGRDEDDEAGNGAATSSRASDQAAWEAIQDWQSVRTKVKKRAPVAVKLRAQQQNLAFLREHLLTGDVDLMRCLLSSMDDDDEDEDAFDIDCQDDLGQTALHYAAEVGSESMVKYLAVDLSSRLATDGLGQTPLHVAAAAGHTSSVALIAEVYQIDFGGGTYDALGARDNLGRTPLFFAAVGGHTDTVRALLEVHSPDKRAECHPHLPPLSPQAVAEDYKSQLHRDSMGDTAIHAAAQAGHDGTVLELLDILERSGAQDELGPLLSEARGQLSGLALGGNPTDAGSSGGGCRGNTAAAAAPPLAGDGDTGLCVICLVEEPSISFIHGDSGHLCCCRECLPEYKRQGNGLCPVCRESYVAIPDVNMIFKA